MYGKSSPKAREAAAPMSKGRGNKLFLNNDKIFI